MANDEAFPEESPASLNLLGMDEGRYEFVVKNYSLRKIINEEAIIESEEFTLSRYQWTVCFFPNGSNADAGYASLFIIFKSQTSDYVQILFDLFILDQSGKGKHQGISLYNSPPKVYPVLCYGKSVGHANFIRREYLEKQPSDYLKDDCLKISCKIGVIKFSIQKLPPIKVPPKSNVGMYFGKLLETKQGADVFFNVSGEIFCAHSLILAARAPVFRSHLKDDAHRTKEIVVPDIEPRIFKALLWFIYTGVILEEEQEAFNDCGPFILNSFMGKIFAAADRFGLEKLKRLCVSHVLERVCVESVGYLLHLADRHHATELKHACLTFASENRAAVMESEGFEYLKEACPLLFLELAGFSEKPSTSIGKEAELSSKMVCIVKESLVGTCWGPRVAAAQGSKSKIKEV